MSTEQGPMEARVGVLPLSSVETVSVSQSCRGMGKASGEMVGRMAQERVDSSGDSHDETTDLRHATLRTCPPMAVVPATGLVM